MAEAKPSPNFFTERTPEPVHVQPLPVPVAEPAAVAAAASAFEEELDVPAYLRQGKLLN